MEESNLISTDNQTNSKKSKRGGARPGAGRPKKLNAPMTRLDRIKILESKLPGAGPKAAAALSRQISLLSGQEKPYARNVPEQKQRDTQLADPPEPVQPTLPPETYPEPVPTREQLFERKLRTQSMTVAEMSEFEALLEERWAYRRTVSMGPEPSNAREFEALEALGAYDFANYCRWKQRGALPIKS